MNTPATPPDESPGDSADDVPGGAPAGFVLEVQPRGRWMVLRVRGDVDIYTVLALRQRVQGLLESSSRASARMTAGPGVPAPITTAPPPEAQVRARMETKESTSAPVDTALGVVLDLSEVAFMDSAGLGVLVSEHKRARALGLELRLAGLDRRVLHLLELTGLGRVLAVYSDVDQAVAPSP